VLDAANDVTSSREDLAQAVVDALDALSPDGDQDLEDDNGGNSRAVRGDPPDRKPVDRITDRAKRYRAQKAIRGPRRCVLCGARADWT